MKFYYASYILAAAASYVSVIIPSVAAQELTTDALEADIAANPAPPGKNGMCVCFVHVMCACDVCIMSNDDDTHTHHRI